MKRDYRLLVLLLLSVLLLTGCSTQIAARNDGQSDGQSETSSVGFTENPESIEQAAQSVVKLTNYDKDGDVVASGSGFILFEADVLVTCVHVIVNMEYLLATDEAGNSYRLGWEDVIAEDEDYDLAICRIPEKTDYTPLPYSTGATKRGEKVLAIGSQFGVLNLVTSGIVSGSWNSETVQTILFTAPVSSGSSGGPVFDDTGQVIGIIMGTYDDSQNLNIAVPVEEAEQLYLTYVKEKEE